MSIFQRAMSAVRRVTSLSDRMTQIQMALGRIEQRQVAQSGAGIAQSEFKVFSQWGEDGIIQFLASRVPIERPLFVEFGVENYTESNTRFLCLNNGWAGLVLDGSAENVACIRKDPIYWAANLKAEHAFITRKNINSLITQNGITGDIGLLSVDIDGNDYWVWQAIDCISPRIVICEYNSLFGATARVSTPYDPGFVRDRFHSSRAIYGASIAALHDLGTSKGYSLVAGNSAGNNVFFVRNDVLGELRPLAPAEAFRAARFREYHDERGQLTFDDMGTRRRKLADVSVHDLASDRIRPLGEIPGIAAP